MIKIRTYRELKRIPDFVGRFDYLKLAGSIGESTFGFDRYLNQMLYKSSKWRETRNHVLIRDNGCDLGVEGHEIYEKVIIHHMNPITVEDIEKCSEDIFNPEYLICVSHQTHNAIHYGDLSLLPKPFVERQPWDTCPWRHSEVQK